jgi:hypothetical protein
VADGAAATGAVSGAWEAQAVRSAQTLARVARRNIIVVYKKTIQERNTPIMTQLARETHTARAGKLVRIVAQFPHFSKICNLERNLLKSRHISTNVLRCALFPRPCGALASRL